jgi:hypothetical protein
MQTGGSPRQFPEPLSDTDCGEFFALSLIVMLPDFEPLLVGLNTTFITQLALGFNVVVLVQPVPLPKAKLPLTLKPFSVNAVVPVFFSVTCFAELVVPDFWFPKLRLVGLSVAIGLITVAVISTICGLPAALSVITRLAACVLVTFESPV